MIVRRRLSKKQSILRQKLACSRHQSYVRLISAVHIASNQPTLLWPNHRPLLPEIPTITPLKNLCHLWHQNYQTSCLLAKPPIRRLERRRKNTTTKHKYGGTPAPWLPMSIQLISPAEHATAKIEKT